MYIACLSGNDVIIEKLLNWKLSGFKSLTPEHCQLICPVDFNAQCGIGNESALMAAVRGGFAYIVSLLLRNGIDPNIVNSNLMDEMANGENSYNLVLLEAVRQRSWILTELLLR